MHTPFPFFTLFFIFVMTTFVYRAYLEHKRKARDDAFWAREEEAKSAPTVDLSSITYIDIPLSSFPIGKLDTDESIMLEEDLTALSRYRILNLANMTNTDIRLTYGADNFDQMQVIGDNFDRMETLLCDYAKLLMENNMIPEAIPVLEFAVKEGATISTIYELLGECYAVTGNREGLASLISTIESSDLMMKDVLLGKISNTSPD